MALSLLSPVIDRHVYQEDDASHNTVCDLTVICIVRELQTKSPVDDAEYDEHTAVPDMPVADERTPTDFPVLVVM